eukprot:TRINITY_DN18969_c0_g2_i1.p1 TRINITY_DN18969_c0_g2~~TRINITY_DN18969_c0_g2_i1.p1  ORF type:complete len:902 (+),score=209.83 TRINITY_DN18969_c0_g2_i1:154-2859(+)
MATASKAGAPVPHASGRRGGNGTGGEFGELFVPFTVLPSSSWGGAASSTSPAAQAAAATEDVVLSVRLRCLEGLNPGGHPPKLSVGFRFGLGAASQGGYPGGANAARGKKAPGDSAKCQMELVRDPSTGAWVPEAGPGAAVRVSIPPPLMAQAAAAGQGGLVCWIKVTAPGFVTANVLAISEPLCVPLEPRKVPLAAPKAPQEAISATLSIGWLVSFPVQSQLAAGLVSDLVAQLRQPENGAAASATGSRAAQLAAVLRPARGWASAVDVPGRLAHAGGVGRSALRIAVDEGKLSCVQELLEARCDPRALGGSDLRSPLTAALEREDSDGRLAAALAPDRPGAPGLGKEQWRVCGDLVRLLGKQRRQHRTPAPPASAASVASARLPPQSAQSVQRGSASGGSVRDLSGRWEALARDIASHFAPATSPGASSAAATSGENGGSSGRWMSADVFILALDICRTGRARRSLLCAPGACAALWRVCLDEDLPDVARQIAVWIGISLTGVEDGAPSRHDLLDVPLPARRSSPTSIASSSGDAEDGTMLAATLRRAAGDARWLRVARVLAQMGARATAAAAGAPGPSPLLRLLDQADTERVPGFDGLLSLLLGKLGEDVDQWTSPTALLEERTAECPICFETLWTSTPTAFVGFGFPGGAGGPKAADEPHVICAHFFCFDCASQQYVKQQAQGKGEYHCPMCRVKAQDLWSLPDIAVNPRLWFRFLDTDGSRCVDRNTAVQALEATLPLDTENLRDAMSQSCWKEWAPSADSRIREADFFAQGGLLEWVRGHQHELAAARSRGAAPPLDQAEDWFKHWDRSKRDRLRRGDALRGLLEAAGVSSLETAKVRQLREAVAAVWARFAAADGTLSRETFLAADVARVLSRACAGESLADLLPPSGSGGAGG